MAQGPVPESAVARVRAIEREVGRPGTRRSYTHAQLLTVVELTMQGVAEEDAWATVGPPSQVLQPGEPSHAELVAVAAGFLPPPPGRPGGAPQSARLVDVRVGGQPERLTRAADDKEHG